MIKISHKVLLGDFDTFEEVMSREITESEVFIWIFILFLHSFINDNNAQSFNCLH